MARQNAEKLFTSKIVLISNTRIYRDWKIAMAEQNICLIFNFMAYFFGKTSDQISRLIVITLLKWKSAIDLSEKRDSVVLKQLL